MVIDRLWPYFYLSILWGLIMTHAWPKIHKFYIKNGTIWWLGKFRANIKITANGANEIAWNCYNIFSIIRFSGKHNFSRLDTCGELLPTYCNSNVLLRYEINYHSYCFHGYITIFTAFTQPLEWGIPLRMKMEWVLCYFSFSCSVFIHMNSTRGKPYKANHIICRYNCFVFVKYKTTYGKKLKTKIVISN